MTTINDFKRFAKGGEEKKEENNYVLSYTRVSSKDQAMNYSLNNQKEAAEKYAKENGYIISEHFGGTYESASGDITRKEFMRLIDKIKSSKKKPFAVLIYIMSRFSRSGGGGVKWAFELDEIGVNIIEISTGENTLTERGKIAIYTKLLKAREETLNKLDVSIPGMIKHLTNGKWLGNVPIGYDHYGPRVKDYTKIRPEQKIVINEDGKLLQQAWQWKLQGIADVDISKRLATMGLEIKPKKLSPMWRNPFYCGICCNKMLGENVVNGNWDKIVSQEEFLIINDRLDGKHQPYKVEKANPDRPLNGFITCSVCGSKMVGYKVKKKGLHYYKCLNCKGVSINANTTKKAKKEGAHDLFMSLLTNYELPELFAEPFKEQLKLTFDTINTESVNEERILKEQLTKEQENLKKLSRRYAIDGLDENLYKEFKAELDGKINEINANLQNCSVNTSNLKKYINTSMDVAQNISKYWYSNDSKIKKGIQELVFPEGLSLDVKNRQYLTKNVNEVFALIQDMTGKVETKNKGTFQNLFEKSPVVARSRIELETSGL